MDQSSSPVPELTPDRDSDAIRVNEEILGQTEGSIDQPGNLFPVSKAGEAWLRFGVTVRAHLNYSATPAQEKKGERHALDHFSHGAKVGREVPTSLCATPEFFVVRW